MSINTAYTKSILHDALEHVLRDYLNKNIPNNNHDIVACYVLLTDIDQTSLKELVSNMKKYLSPKAVKCVLHIIEEMYLNKVTMRFINWTENNIVLFDQVLTDYEQITCK